MIIFCNYCQLEQEVDIEGTCPDCGLVLAKKRRKKPEEYDDRWENDWEEEDIDGEL